MAEANIDPDELLLMRHLEGRLGSSDTAALEARLAVEPRLREKLAALELENDLITGAVSVPDDVELPEPLMAAIIESALKDPKRQPAERRWWKPVLLSLSAAAAVALAAVSIYMAGNEPKPSEVVIGVNPERGSVLNYSGDKPNAPASLLASGAEVLPGDTLTSAGGTASVQLLDGIALHFDHNTRLRLIAMRPHEPVQFELAGGALIVEYQPPARVGGGNAVLPADDSHGVIVRTADGQMLVTLRTGRVLIEPLGASATTAAARGADYLVYMPSGKGTVADPTTLTGNQRSHQRALTDGTQVRWPADAVFNRVVRRDSLVCDLITGWQAAHAITATDEKWWQHELTYDGLDQAWPIAWARDLAEALRAPSFLKQAQALDDTLTSTGELAPLSPPAAPAAPAAPVDDAAALGVRNRWLDMSTALEDTASYQQLSPSLRVTWDMLAVKANLLAYRAVRLSQGHLAADLPLKRITAHLRVLDTQAAQATAAALAANTPADPRLQNAATWLRMESDLLDEPVADNIAARYKSFSADHPTAVESAALQLRLALLQPSGDARQAALNAAWQFCHAFQVHLEQPLQQKPDALWRLLEIKTAILGALADELYSHGLASEGDELIRTVDYLGLGLPASAGSPADAPGGYRNAGAVLFDELVAQAVGRAQQELAAGHADRAEPILITHMPSALATALLRDIDRNNPSVPTTTATAERWAAAYDACLSAPGREADQKAFREQAKLFLPAPTPAVTVAPAPPPAAPPALDPAESTPRAN